MTEITLKIPEWAEERRVYIFLGRECYIVRDHNGKWYQKTVRCNLCGKCCENPGENWHLGTQIIDGKVYCSKIKKQANQFWCESGVAGPFGCTAESPTGFMNHEDCVIKYEEIVP